MTDEEFSKLKEDIKEVGSMSREINSVFGGLKVYLTELNKSIARFESDIDTLKSEANSLNGD